MKHVMAWMASAAVLNFTKPVSGGQNDPRLPMLFDELNAAIDPDEAASIEMSIWELWTISGDSDVDQLMALGLVALSNEQFSEAIAVFDKIVEIMPGFAEGWNKRATAYYLIGDYQRSTADVEKVLALEPRHFGALSGLGLIALNIGELEQALEAFETALMIHPHMSGADTQIRMLRDKLRGRDI